MSRTPYLQLGPQRGDQDLNRELMAGNDWNADRGYCRWSAGVIARPISHIRLNVDEVWKWTGYQTMEGGTASSRDANARKVSSFCTK